MINRIEIFTPYDLAIWSSKGYVVKVIGNRVYAQRWV